MARRIILFLLHSQYSTLFIIYQFPSCLLVLSSRIALHIARRQKGQSRNDGYIEWSEPLVRPLRGDDSKSRSSLPVPEVPSRWSPGERCLMEGTVRKDGIEVQPAQWRLKASQRMRAETAKRKLVNDIGMAVKEIENIETRYLIVDISRWREKLRRRGNRTTHQRRGEGAPW